MTCVAWRQRRRSAASAAASLTHAISTSCELSVEVAGVLACSLQLAYATAVDSDGDPRLHRSDRRGQLGVARRLPPAAAARGAARPPCRHDAAMVVAAPEVPEAASDAPPPPPVHMPTNDESEELLKIRHTRRTQDGDGRRSCGRTRR